MARALRPVVLLMVIASLLFMADGYSDGVLPGTNAWIGGTEYHGLGWSSYVFALVNLLVAIAIARGSERTLLGRAALSGFFLVERPLTAVVLGPKPALSIGLHAAAAIVELVILLGALRVWRLGHSAGDDLTAVFSLGSASSPAAAAPDGLGAAPDGLGAAPDGLGAAPDGVGAAPGGGERAPEAITAGASWLIGLLTLLLSAVLVADGVVARFVPGGREWGLAGDSTGWLVYLFAIVVLTISVRAVHGATLALRMLFALALILFIERAFSPFVSKGEDTVALGLHVLAAFVSLALALASASVLRAGGARAARRMASLETA